MSISYESQLNDWVNKEKSAVEAKLNEFNSLDEKFNEIKDLIKGIKPSRDDFDDNPSPSPTPKTSVPKTGGTAAPQTN